jgi:nicotinic acid phosphoribosyltransferase
MRTKMSSTSIGSVDPPVPVATAFRGRPPVGAEPMAKNPAWVTDDNAALLTDLYELTMLQAYWRERMRDEAAFSLFARKLPPQRNFLVACGLEDVLRYLERLHFGRGALDYLASLGIFAA